MRLELSTRRLATRSSRRTTSADASERCIARVGTRRRRADGCAVRAHVMGRRGEDAASTETQSACTETSPTSRRTRAPRSRGLPRRSPAAADTGIGGGSRTSNRSNVGCQRSPQRGPRGECRRGWPDSPTTPLRRHEPRPPSAGEAATEADREAQAARRDGRCARPGGVYRSCGRSVPRLLALARSSALPSISRTAPSSAA